jgi:hypothetical protein
MMELRKVRNGVSLIAALLCAPAAALLCFLGAPPLASLAVLIGAASLMIIHLFMLSAFIGALPAGKPSDSFFRGCAAVVPIAAALFLAYAAGRADKGLLPAAAAGIMTMPLALTAYGFLQGLRIGVRRRG